MKIDKAIDLMSSRDNNINCVTVLHRGQYKPASIVEILAESGEVLVDVQEGPHVVYKLNEVHEGIPEEIDSSLFAVMPDDDDTVDEVRDLLTAMDHDVRELMEDAERLGITDADLEDVDG